MVVPRTAKCAPSYSRTAKVSTDFVDSLVVSDDDFSLFSVVVFRRVHDDFVQKCREHK